MDEDFMISFGHPLLEEVFADLIQRSQTLRGAVNKMRERNFGLRISTPDELLALNRSRPANAAIEINPAHAAVSAYTTEADGTVPMAGAFVDLDRIHELARPRPGAPIDSARARVAVRDALIHELYGHIAPIGKSGRGDAAVPDPRPRERFERSAIGQRENVIRQELGLLPRTSYALFD